MCKTNLYQRCLFLLISVKLLCVADEKFELSRDKMLKTFNVWASMYSIIICITVNSYFNILFSSKFNYFRRHNINEWYFLQLNTMSTFLHSAYERFYCFVWNRNYCCKCMHRIAFICKFLIHHSKKTNSAFFFFLY